MSVLIPLVLAALGAPSPVFQPHVERLPDGAELVVVTVPGAPTLAFRYLVHAGGNLDPMPGLAHLLEHVIFHGTYRAGQQDLFRAVHARGAYLNGFTGPDTTHYVIDAPRRDAEPLVRQMIATLTSPVLSPAALERERAVVLAEDELRTSEGIHTLMMQLLSPAFRAPGAVMGTARTRTNIERADLVAFYTAHYRPSNTTLILVGDITPQAARALVESADRGALESAPGERAAPTTSLTTPIEAQLPAPFYLTLIGYDLSGAEAAVCDGLGELLDLRLRIALTIERTTADQVSAACLTVSGHQLLAAVAWSTSYSGAEVRDELERAYRELRSRPATAQERGHIERRATSRLARQLGDLPALADALVEALSGDRPGSDRRPALGVVFEAPRLDGSAMQKAAAHLIEDSRRVVIHAAPF